MFGQQVYIDLTIANKKLLVTVNVGSILICGTFVTLVMSDVYVIQN